MEERILVVEDEEKILRLLQLELSHEGYVVDVAVTGREALEKASAESWSLIILDVMLPELNGVEVLRRFRKTDSTTPIIMLTARNSTPDKVSGLDLGANDYMTKPFEIEELLARMRACMRNRAAEPAANEADNNTEIHLDNLRINRNTREVVRDDRHIELTPKEYDLLLYMLENKSHVLDREQIIHHVWGYDFTGDTNVVDVYVRYLRKKIDQDYPVKLIHTIRGVGYCLREEKREA